MSHVNPQSFRTNFPILENTVYLSSCSLGARSQQLDKAMTSMLDSMSEGAGAWHMFEEQVAEARAKFARLIGARPEQIAVVPNASVGAYQIASCIDWRDQPEIITSPAEFPSIAHVWLAQKTRGAEILHTKAASGEAFFDHISSNTGLVSIPIISYSDGQRLDVRSITEAAHSRGARVFVDAYQAIGVEPVDVNELNCDFLVAGASKYMLGLPGVAFVYEREARRGDCDPQLTGWFGRVNPFAFDAHTLDFAEDARRYETGTPSIPSLYAANAGLDLLLDLDLNEVRTHVKSLVNHVHDRFEDMSIAISGPKDGADRGAHVSLCDPSAKTLETNLASDHISISSRGDIARLAFHYYNTQADADAACDKIAEYREQQMPSLKCVGCTKPCAKAIKIQSPDSIAMEALDTWVAAPKPKDFPYTEVVDAYHENGKAFVSNSLLLQLDSIRAGLPKIGAKLSEKKRLASFLDVVLDKFDDTYEYPSYCALPLWPLPTNPGAKPDMKTISAMRDRQLLALAADYLRFEMDAFHGRTDLMPSMPTDMRCHSKRLRLGLNSMRPVIARMNLPIDYNASNIEAEVIKLCALVDDMLSAQEKQDLMLTMLPVDVIHDEYMFLRILQSFETNFAWMAIRLRSAIEAFDTDPGRVSELIDDANRMYKEAAKFFPVLATMRGDSFQAFRENTEGASAIQSRNYKTVESLCRAPDAPRLDSLAYQSVPEVHKKVVNGQRSIDEALIAARKEGRITQEADDAISASMLEFSNTLTKWRQTHYRLAVKMLGEQPGTGKTEGTPYLAAVRDIPVFKSVSQGEAPC